MRKLYILALLALALATLTSACTTESRGDREFIPGKGWQPVE